MSLESKRQQLADFNVKASSDNDAKKRLTALFDPDTFVEMDEFAMTNDFSCGFVTGYAVGRVHAEKIKKVYEMASKTGAPVVAIYDSKGARLNEGFDALAGYGDMLALSNNLSGVVPQVAVVLGTCAGVSAMLACGADFVVMSESE